MTPLGGAASCGSLPLESGKPDEVLFVEGAASCSAMTPFCALDTAEILLTGVKLNTNSGNKRFVFTVFIKSAPRLGPAI